jgi:hypothetical protein
MTTTDPTPLAEQIAREHYLTTRARCACPDAIDAGRDTRAWVAHIATVTEQAVRARVAAELKAAAAEDTGWPADPEQIALTYRRAARIAKGDHDA